MFFSKVLLCLVSFSLVLSHPITERSQQNNEPVNNIKAPSQIVEKVPPKAIRDYKQYIGRDYREDARKANMAPGRVIPKACKKVADCSCPKSADKKAIHSTSCINGFCQCDNPVVNFFGNKFIDAVKAVGNAPITKAIGHLMQGLADVKQVVSVIAGAVLGPPAKAALKAALLAFPDTGPSHIDKATKGILTKGL
ncbi:hypothetical protein D9615_010403 [Tricholomella constricta]|uniref:Uncharacterized protein n=1 Tax=Tricholomella constricta TaxID=117010 RepID=A0A8H5GPD5_9AGAR|nr:hypothetical protein D9615_010403 [Tricholomella constricta]